MRVQVRVRVRVGVKARVRVRQVIKLLDAPVPRRSGAVVTHPHLPRQVTGPG